MFLAAALSWPEATVRATLIASVALVLAVLIWSIFRTGQTAIRSESKQREPVDELRGELDELRGRVDRLGPA
jgi:hypothetical protein